MKKPKKAGAVHLQGRIANTQQGTQGPTTLNQPASVYRASQRAPKTGSTTFTDSWAADKKDRDKRAGVKSRKYNS